MSHPEDAHQPDQPHHQQWPSTQPGSPVSPVFPGAPTAPAPSHPEMPQFGAVQPPHGGTPPQFGTGGSGWAYATDIPAPEPRRRRRLTTILVAAGAVVALLLGGAAYAGYKLWYGSGSQPEDTMPASVVAFARLDLSPGLGQRLTLSRLLSRFPQQRSGDGVTNLQESLFGSLGVDKQAYKSRIEPWFGDRFGIAVWLDGDNTPYALLSLAAKDEGAARTGLAELQREKDKAEFGYVVRAGYALIALGSKGAQAAAEVAAKEAERGSLRDSAGFSRGMDWLPERQLLVGWLDLAKLGAFGKELLAKNAGSGPEVFGLDALDGFDRFTGQMVIGGQVTDSSVEVRMRAFGAGTATPTVGAGVRSTMDALPGNTVVAAAVQADTVDSLTRLAKLDRMSGPLASLGKGLAALSGARIALAIAAVPGAGVPPLLATAETTSTEQARQLVDALKGIGPLATVTSNGTKVELKTNGYEAAGGSLGENLLYREALAGTPSGPTTLVYADLESILARTRDGKELEPLKALVLALGVQDKDQVMLLRLVIK